MSRAFATVGTTQFDALTSTLLSRELLETLRRQGYGELLVQYGRGAEPAPPTQPPLDVAMYRFKKSLRLDMERAALIITHAGAGSILEGLRQRAVLVVVVNDLLMDNHQAELAYALHTRGHVIATTPSQLVATLRDLHARAPRLVPLPDADPSAFGRFLETELGI